MFEWADTQPEISEEAYRSAVDKLRMELLDAQYDLLENKKFPVILVIGGVDGAGKGETVNLLNEWMDPRHIHTHAFGPPNDVESELPYMYRFWQALPPKGSVGMLFGSWYSTPIIDRVYRRIKNPKFDQYLDEIIAFEQMLVRDSALILKLWFHLNKKDQKERLQSLEKNPLTRWRVRDTDWERFKLYDRFRKHAEHALSRTSSAEAPWHVINGKFARNRSLAVGNLLLQAMRTRLDNPAPVFQVPTYLKLTGAPNPLEKLQYDHDMSKADFKTALERWQGRLNLLSRSSSFQKKGAAVVFEGTDAAGKGSAIRRITRALDARQYQIIPIAAPTPDEKAQPYLWRFWRKLPQRGRFSIFDRSWYGRVLVERVEGFCSESDWLRAYSEINDFEAQLQESGIIVIKCYLAITKEEQLKRFNERKTIGFKRFKITDEDWRNREKWDQYEAAVNDMLARTGTLDAPWQVIPANNKYHARIQVLKTICNRLEEVL
jgi:polyphosphate:AMP phosphotransferase